MNHRRQLLPEIPKYEFDSFTNALMKVCSTAIYAETTDDKLKRDIQNIAIRILNMLKTSYADVDYDETECEVWIIGILTTIPTILKNYIDTHEFRHSIIDHAIKCLIKTKDQLDTQDFLDTVGKNYLED